MQPNSYDNKLKHSNRLYCIQEKSLNQGLPMFTPISCKVIYKLSSLHYTSSLIWLQIAPSTEFYMYNKWLQPVGQGDIVTNSLIKGLAKHLKSENNSKKWTIIGVSTSLQHKAKYVTKKCLSTTLTQHLC